MAVRPESEGWAEGDPEMRGRVPGSFPTVACIGVWGSPPSCGLGQQRAGGKWYSGQAQVRPAACSFPGENARSWEALGEARPGQSSLSEEGKGGSGAGKLEMKQ